MPVSSERLFHKMAFTASRRSRRPFATRSVVVEVCEPRLLLSATGTSEIRFADVPTGRLPEGWTSSSMQVQDGDLLVWSRREFDTITHTYSDRESVTYSAPEIIPVSRGVVRNVQFQLAGEEYDIIFRVINDRTQYARLLVHMKSSDGEVLVDSIELGRLGFREKVGFQVAMSVGGVLTATVSRASQVFEYEHEFAGWTAKGKTVLRLPGRIGSVGGLRGFVASSVVGPLTTANEPSGPTIQPKLSIDAIHGNSVQFAFSSPQDGSFVRISGGGFKSEAAFEHEGGTVLSLIHI